MQNIGFIKKGLELLAYSNIWVSLSAVFLTLHSYIVFGWKIDALFLIMVFFATLASYNFQRISRLPRTTSHENERHLWVVNNKAILSVVVFVSILIASILFLLQFNFIDLLYVSPLLFIGTFYAYQLPKGEKSLRDLPYFKIILIALSWVAVCILLPAYKNDELTFEIAKLSLVLFFYIIGVTIPFDVRDLKYDNEEQKTIPQLIGVRNSMFLAEVFILFAMVMHWYWFSDLNCVLILFAISMVFIAFTKESRSELFYLIGIDGLFILFPFFSILCR